MAWVPIVLGIQASYPKMRCQQVEIIYKSGDYRMRLDNIHESEAQLEIEKHSRQWTAHCWRYMDGVSDWEYVR